MNTVLPAYETLTIPTPQADGTIKNVEIYHHESWVSVKNLYHACGVAIRNHKDYLEKFQQGFLPCPKVHDRPAMKAQDIVTHLSSIVRRAKSKEVVQFFINNLISLVKPQSEKVEDSTIYVDQPLEAVDFFRRDLSLTDGFAPEDIKAALQTGRVKLYRNGKNVRTTFRIHDYDFNIRALKREEGLDSEREACYKSPETLVFDTRKHWRELDSLESIRQGKLVTVDRYDFHTYEPWLTYELLQVANAKRKKLEAQKMVDFKINYYKDLFAQEDSGIKVNWGRARPNQEKLNQGILELEPYDDTMQKPSALRKKPHQESRCHAVPA